MPFIRNDSTGEVAYLDSQGQLVPFTPENQQVINEDLRGINPQPVGSGEAAAIGFAKAGDDLWRNVGGLIPGVDTSRPQADIDAYDYLQETHPYATTAGEIGQGMLFPGMGAGGVVGRMATNAAVGALTGDNDQSLAERAAWGWAGGEVGNMASRLLGRFGRALSGKSVLEDTAQGRMTRQFERTAPGMYMTPGERGSRGLQNVESFFEALPITDDFYSRLQMDREKELVQRVGRALDLPTNITDDALSVDRTMLRDAGDTIGERFKRLYQEFSGDTVTLEPNTVDRLIDVIDDDTKQLMQNRHGFRMLSGRQDVSPEAAGMLRTALTNQLGYTKSGNSIQNIGDVMDLLEADIKGSMGGDYFDAYRELLDQYELFATLDSTYQKAEGGMNWRSLWNKIADRGTKEMQSGHRNRKFDELRDFVQPLASTVNQIPFNTSGTARSSNVTDVLTTPAGLLSWLAAKPYYSDTGQASIRALQDAGPASAGVLEFGTRLGRESAGDDDNVIRELLGTP